MTLALLVSWGPVMSNENHVKALKVASNTWVGPSFIVNKNNLKVPLSSNTLRLEVLDSSFHICILSGSVFLHLTQTRAYNIFEDAVDFVVPLADGE